MNLPAQLFPVELLWLANLSFFILLGRAIWFAPWRGLLSNAARVNALVGLTLGLFVFWQLNAGVRPGFNHHVLGATLFMLMFGWRIAMIAMTLIMLATWLYTDLHLITLGINGLVMIAVPILFSEAVLRLSRRHLSKNFFFFTLGNGFVCAGFAILLTILSAALLMTIFSHYTWANVQHNYLGMAPVIIFVESFATGMIITGFALASPEAIFNFDVDEYMTGK